MRRSRLLAPAFALLLSACGGGPRPVYAPLPPERTAEKPRPVYVKPSFPARPGQVAPVPVPQNLAGPLTVARIEPYMDALETEVRRHVHARGIITARRGNDIAVSIEDALLFTADGGVSGDDILEPLAAILRGYGHVAVAVGGYTDTAGPAARNLETSQKRARQIADALVHAGVPAGRVTAQGFGATRPRVVTGPDRHEPRNRRIEIVLRPVPG